MRKSCSKAVLRWNLLWISKAFVRWNEHTVRYKHLKITADRIFRRLKNRSITLAMDRWSEFMKGRNRKQSATEISKAPKNGIYLRSCLRIVANAWTTWHCHHIRHVRARALRYQVICRIMTASQARAMDRWKRRSGEQKRLIRASKKVIVRWQKFWLSLPFAQWIGIVWEQRRQKNILEKTWVKMLNNLICKAYRMWNVHVRENRYCRGLFEENDFAY